MTSESKTVAEGLHIQNLTLLGNSMASQLKQARADSTLPARWSEYVNKHGLSSVLRDATSFPPAGWLLYEHEDGRHAVAVSAEAALFAQGDPHWHRVGPVEVHFGAELGVGGPTNG